MVHLAKVSAAIEVRHGDAVQATGAKGKDQLRLDVEPVVSVDRAIRARAILPGLRPRGCCEQGEGRHYDDGRD